MLSRPEIDYDALVKEDRVHISLYTDPAIFTDEMDKIFIADGFTSDIAAKFPTQAISGSNESACNR